MAGLTLSQTAELTQDELQAGVIQTMATESKLLAVLPFMSVEGHGYSYNVEKSMAGVEFRALNTAYNTVAPTTERKTEYLSILGGEAIVDSFQMEVHSNINDLMAVEVALTSKAIVHTFEKYFINGDVAQDKNAFNGLLFRNLPEIEGSADVQADIDVLLDMVQGGADALVMNKKTRRTLTARARDYVTYQVNQFGVQVTYFGGVPVIDLDAELLADEIIVAVRFGVHEAVAGLQSKSGVKVKSLGELGETPQVKTRIEWFVGMAVFNEKTVAIRKAPVA